MASNFANHAHCSSANHLPDAFHGGEIPVELALESRLVTAVAGSGSRLPIGPAVQWSTISKASARHDSDLNDNRLMRSVGAPIDPWPLLRNSASARPPFALRLVVHGRAGGVVPDGLLSIVDGLQARRQAPVQLEALTADHPPKPPKQPVLLIPLLLWPGSHARQDVPLIRERLRGDGASVTMLPFLGAWPLWWQLVVSALSIGSDPSTVLVHHPLRDGVATRFLASLSAQLGLPLVSFDRWDEHQRSRPQDRPLPLALAPNRMTEALSDANVAPPLLDHPLVRQGFIDLLAALP